MWREKKVTDHGRGRKVLDGTATCVDDIFDAWPRPWTARSRRDGRCDRLARSAREGGYRTGWKARDDATRQRLVEILDRVVGEVEGLRAERAGHRLTAPAQLRLVLDTRPTSP